MEKRNHTSTVPMKETFDRLEYRLIDANEKIEASSLENALDNLKGTTVTTGCGGSLVVADFLTKVLEERGFFCVTKNTRDIIHSKHNMDNLFAYSYSGNTHGIHLVLNQFQGNKYLLTCNNQKEDAICLGYKEMEKEKSFISLSSTLIPIGEFLKYHEKIKKEDFTKKIKLYFQEIKAWLRTLSHQNFLSYGSSEIFEIMTGYDTEVASYFLESTLVEAGLGNPIIHDKYSYCHGRSTINYQDKKTHSLIYLINEKTELDDFLLEVLNNTDYFPVTIIDVSTSNTSSLERQYELLLKSIFLCKKIAQDKKMDLSQVEYNRRIIQKVYQYKGEM